MSTSYKSTGGESWALVAIQTTGNDMDADAIRRANPGISEPLPSGVSVQIPVTPSQASAVPGNPSIVVEGIEIGTFDDFELVRSIDAISKGAFVVPNEPETRDIFRPLYYPEIQICAMDKRIFTGRCDSPVPDNQSDMKVLNLSCFSLPGILEMSGPPIDAFPLEYKKQNLQGIASDLCWKHGISTVFDEDAGGWFKRVDIQPGASTLGFLSDLAKQRSFIISDNPQGELVFWTGKKTGNPVGSYRADSFPCVGIGTSIDDGAYYSSVTGYAAGRSRRDFKGAGYTITNKYMTDVIRPYLERFEDIDEGELPVAVNGLAGRMFSQVFSVNLELATWFDDAGELFTPNTTVLIQSPDDFIPEPYEFLISMVSFKKQSDSMTCSLSCVLPGVFSGEIPERLPWQK